MNNLEKSLAYEYAELGAEAKKMASVIMPIVKRAEYSKLSAKEYDTLVHNLWVVNHVSTERSHSKLDGGCSISTDCHSCKFCRTMWQRALAEIAQKGDTNIICSRCYSDTNGKLHKGLANRNMLNKFILSVPIPQEAWYAGLQIPMSAEFYRTESFGETDTVIEARNFLRIHRAIERIWNLPSAVFSKNSSVWATAFKFEGKPMNTTYVQSSPRINIRTPIAPCIEPWVDHRFTVFDKDYIAKNRVRINCGGRSCLECKRNHVGCYYKGIDFDIAEELK